MKWKPNMTEEERVNYNAYRRKIYKKNPSSVLSTKQEKRQKEQVKNLLKKLLS